MKMIVFGEMCAVLAAGARHSNGVRTSPSGDGCRVGLASLLLSRVECRGRRREKKSYLFDLIRRFKEFFLLFIQNFSFN